MRGKRGAQPQRIYSDSDGEHVLLLPSWKFHACIFNYLLCTVITNYST